MKAVKFVIAALAVGAVLCLIWLPGRLDQGEGFREHTRRTACKDNLKAIALALHNYHDAYKSFPPAYIADKDGKPMHSWRVLILPYMDEGQCFKNYDYSKPSDAPENRDVLEKMPDALLKNYDFSKPWDAPENRDVLENMPSIFSCPSNASAPPNTTSYVGVFGNGCIFDPERPVRIRDVKDGMTRTLMVGEVVDGTIPWTKPEDIDVSLHPGINKPGGFGSRHEGGCQFALCDGSVKFVQDDTDPETLYHLFHRNDGKPIDPAF